MIPDSFSSAIAFVVSQSYLLIFVIMVLEGPIITTAAAFAASLGYFNIWIIFVLSLLGDLVGDGLHYVIGRIGRVAFVEKLGISFGIKKNELKRLEKTMHKHLGKSMLLVKFIPFFTTPGLMMAGALKAPPKKYILYSFLITLPRTIFFVLLGFYFGMAASLVLDYLKLGEYVLLIGVFVVFVVFILFRKISGKIAKEIEKD